MTPHRMHARQAKMLDNLADGISVEGMESLIPHWSANPRRRRPTAPTDGAPDGDD